jgi:hypothetical protein
MAARGGALLAVGEKVRVDHTAQLLVIDHVQFLQAG